MNITSGKYQEAYNMLNAAQKTAVDTIEGPVMVIAGPGTGKTQILALRVCKICETQDIGFQNILCLTFTDSGSVAMRKRLLEFIGPEAYDIPIYTYHAFANKIITENADQFGTYRSLQSLSELESIEVFQELIDGFDNEHILKRLKGKIYHDIPDLKKLFSTLKREDWDLEWFEAAIEKYREEEVAENFYNYHYKKNYKEFKKDDPKVADLKKHNTKCDKLIAAAKEIKNYQKIMHKRERFDYDDMIQWVLVAFENNEALKARYQEQFQYILADEYQDTNGSQNQLLMNLADYWERPNLFVVGDDDQSIFRFQGASMKNIIDFKEKYDPEVVILSHNYRSTQSILNGAMSVINVNTDRLVNAMQLDKKLIAANPKRASGPAPEIRFFDNSYHEEVAIFEAIKQWQHDGIPLNECAIMYRSHKEIDGLVKVLTHEQIPFQLKRRVNVLDQTLIRSVLEILHLVEAIYTRSNSIDAHLYPSLYLSHFGINIQTMHALSLLVNEQSSWYKVIMDESQWSSLPQAKEIKHFVACLESWMKDRANNTIQILLENVMHSAGFMAEALENRDNYFSFQLLQSFFDHIKEQSAIFPNKSLKDHLNDLEKMQENSIALGLNQVIVKTDGVQLMTVHASKGLEFQKVWLIGANKNRWEGKIARSSQFKIPNQILNANDDTVDDDRRLFYVALTRAEEQLVVSYNESAAEKEKPLESSRFVAELMESSDVVHTQGTVDEQKVLAHLAIRMSPAELPDKDWLDHSLIEKSLENFKLSPTDLNKYLACPIRFYYENILRVPSARRESLGYGSAMHYALEMHISKTRQDEGWLTVTHLLNAFEEGMLKYRSHFTDREFQDRMTYGKQNLTAYYDHYLESWKQPKNILFEHKVSLTHYKDVPISGTLDRIDEYDDHIYVIDYKTGNPASLSKKMKAPNPEKGEIGGDYWRQLAFYKILSDNDHRLSKKMYAAEINMLEKNKKDEFEYKKLVISPEDLRLLDEQIMDTYKNIKEHNFRVGCNEERCDWCQYVKRRSLSK